MFLVSSCTTSLPSSGSTYTLDRYRLDAELRPDLTSEFLSGFLARRIIDSYIGAFTREILDDESSEASVFRKLLYSAMAALFLSYLQGTYREPPMTRTFRFFREYDMVSSGFSFDWFIGSTLLRNMYKDITQGLGGR